MGILAVSRLCHSRGHRGTDRENDRNISLNEIGRERRQPIELAVRRAIDDREVAAFEIAAVVEALVEMTKLLRRQIGGAEQADDGHRVLLGAYCRWPCRHAAKQANELAPSHIAPETQDGA